MTPRDLLNVPDEKIDAALAVAMEWRREGNCWHHRKQSSAPPAYCSEDSPRRLLKDALERAIAAESEDFETRDMIESLMIESSRYHESHATVEAGVIARACLYSLDRGAAERLIAEVKG